MTKESPPSSQLGYVKAWMFRAPGEKLAFLITLLVLFLISFLIYSLNIYVFFSLLVGTVILIQLEQAQYLGNAVRVHKNQYPDIYKVFKEYSALLGIHKASLYIIQDPYLQAYTLGITSCTVVLHSALVEQLNEKELAFVLAHELGHFRAGHTKLSTLFIPAGNQNAIADFLFGWWGRKTEYTCDRCGLILTKDLDSAISALIKLAVGGNLYKEFKVKGYLEQLKTAQKKSVKISEVLGSHPLITNRIAHLYTFWKNRFSVKYNHQQQ